MPPVASVTSANPMDSGASNTPANSPALIATPAISTSRKFAPGPASAIHAARLG